MTYRSLMRMCLAAFLGAVAGSPLQAAVSSAESTSGGFVPPYPLPAAGQAIALGSHVAQAIRPEPHYAASWQYSLFDSYGGGVFLPWYSAAGAYVAAGTGGHNHPDFTGAVLFDFATGTWNLLPDASGTPLRNDSFKVFETNGPPEYEINIGATTPDSVPSPPHPYANLMPLPPELGGGPLGSVVYALQGAQAQESVLSSRSHRFDLATRRWSRYTSNHLGTLNSRLADNDAPSVYDPTARRIWQLPVQIHTTQTIGYIDLTEPSPRWRLSASWPWVGTWDQTHSAWLDDARRLILMQSPTRLVALDLDNIPAGPRLLNFTGTLPPSGNRWELYPPDGNFYYKSYAGNVLWKLTPPAGDPLTGTWTVTSLTVGGATLPSISEAAQASGVRHYTRFFYVPALASFAWIADSFSPVHLVRPPADGAAAATVTFSASPASVVSGASTNLVWSSTNATSCTGGGAWSATGLAPSSSGTPVTPPSTPGSYTYTLSCTGPGGSSPVQSVVVTVTAAAPPPNGALTSVVLVNTATASQTDVVTTFGHVFKQGDVPAGATVVARDANGMPVVLQVDPKATHADGSLRHAVLTARLPAIAAGAAQTVTLFAQATPVATPPPVALADLLATTFDARVSLNVGGTVYAASARDLLQNTAARVWLSGPEVSEWIVGGPVRTAGGIAHPHLAAYFHVRAYAGSPITKVRVDAVVENGWTFVNGAMAFTYVPTVTVGTATVYDNAGANLTHHDHSRWHQVGWWNDSDPRIFVRPDTRYLRDSRAVPNYANVVPQESVLNGYTRSIVPLGVADLRANWSPGGAHPQIGLMPEWYASYVMSAGDVRAFEAVLANDSAGGAFSYHYRDENTGLPVSIDMYPNISEHDAASLVPGTDSNPNRHDGEHQPLIGYLGYLLTGDYFYLEELQFLANWGMLSRSATSRGYAAGIIGGGGSPAGNREIAWSVRTQAVAGAITPSTSVLKAYFTGKANNNLDYMAADWGATSPNALGIRLDVGYSSAGYYAPWQMDFLVSVVNFAVELGYDSANAVTLRNTFNKWPTGRMGQDGSGYCPYYAALYNFGDDVADRGVITLSGVYRSFAQLYQFRFPIPASQPCPTSGFMRVGYDPNAMDYYSNVMQPALAMAVDAGTATQETWNTFLSIAPADYSRGGTWGIVPRGNGGGQSGTLFANGFE